jgi:hypothetical protein
MAGLSQALELMIKQQSNTIIEGGNCNSYSIDIVNKFMFTVDEDGKYHSYDDNPAIIYMDNCINIWMKHGVVHRDNEHRKNDNKPAVIYNEVQMFYKNGLLHNDRIGTSSVLLTNGYNDCRKKNSFMVNDLYWNGLLYTTHNINFIKIPQHLFTTLLFFKIETKCYEWRTKRNMLYSLRYENIHIFDNSYLQKYGVWEPNDINEFKINDNTYELNDDTYKEKSYKNKNDETNIVNEVVKNIENVFTTYPELEKICEVNGKTKESVINHWKFIVKELYYLYVKENIINNIRDYICKNNLKNINFKINEINNNHNPSNIGSIHINNFTAEYIYKLYEQFYNKHVLFTFLTKEKNINYINKYKYYICDNEKNQITMYKCIKCDNEFNNQYFINDKIYCDKCDDFIDIVLN